MPTYEYACKDCGANLEVVQSFKDASLTECPTCGGALRKVFSAAGLIFKGSGWHVKDYASSRPTAGTSAPATTSGSVSDAKDAGTTSGASPTGESSTPAGPALATTPSPAPGPSSPRPSGSTD